MVDLYGPFKAFRENPRKVSFALSCGKDSAVMLDIASRFLDLSRHNFFYFTFYPVVLPYKARYLQRLERKYGIRIDIHEQPVKSGLKQSEAFARIREACGAELTGIGYKIYDSLQRRAILKGHEDGINEKCRFFCPMRDWTNRQIKAYAKAHALQLAPEYSFGATREMDEFSGMRAVVLRHLISEEDYQCAKAQDPRIEVDYERFKDDPECKALTERLPCQDTAFADRH